MEEKWDRREILQKKHLGGTPSRLSAAVVGNASNCSFVLENKDERREPQMEEVVSQDGS
jgi:hypothetical protein